MLAPAAQAPAPTTPHAGAAPVPEIRLSNRVCDQPGLVRTILPKVNGPRLLPPSTQLRRTLFVLESEGRFRAQKPPAAIITINFEPGEEADPTATGNA